MPIVWSINLRSRKLEARKRLAGGVRHRLPGRDVGIENLSRRLERFILGFAKIHFLGQNIRLSDGLYRHPADETRSSVVKSEPQTFAPKSGIPFPANRNDRYLTVPKCNGRRVTRDARRRLAFTRHFNHCGNP